MLGVSGTGVAGFLKGEEAIGEERGMRLNYMKVWHERRARRPCGIARSLPRPYSVSG